MEKREAIVQALIRKDPAVLDNPEVAQAIMVQMKSHRGPLPPSEDFAEYEKTLPGGADRILKMSEASLQSRIDQASRTQDRADDYQKRDFTEARIGQIFAFILGLTVVLGGIYLAATGAQGTGATITLTGLGTILLAFIQGKRRPPNNHP